MIKKFLLWLLPKTLWGDRIYGIYRFYRRFGRFPENPLIRFCDHLVTLKMSEVGYDPLIQYLTDKEYAKSYCSAILGKNFVIETHHVLRNPTEIENFVPDRFPCVIKPTHTSGRVIFCSDTTTHIDRRELKKWFEINHYSKTREKNYRYLSPKIIVEEFFSEDGYTVPDDFKIFCFNGVPKIIQVDTDRFSSPTRNLYDTSWNRIPVTRRYPNREQDDPKPVLLGEMLRVAGELSAPFRFVRVDLYATTAELKIGELTFCPGSATEKFKPDEAEFTLGAYFRSSDTDSLA